MRNTTEAVSLREIYDGERPYRMHRWDHYIPIYERHFTRFRDRPINLLEIGIQYGGGLYMWQQYFHPGSRIHGVDIRGGWLGRDSVSVPLSGSSAGWVHPLPLPE